MSKKTDKIAEAEVENKYIIPLLKKFSLITSDEMYKMRVPVNVQEGKSKKTKEADIVLYNSKGKPFVVVEAKNNKEPLDDEAIGQLDSYCFWLGCPYGIACNGKDFVIRVYLTGNERRYLVKTTIDKLKKDQLFDILEEKVIKQESEIPANIISDQSESYSNLLKEIHQIIRDTDKLDPTAAFDGWSKLLFMKISEEQWSKEHSDIERFNYAIFKERRKLGQAGTLVRETFENTCKKYPNIFKKEEEIGLSLNVVGKILEKFDGYKIQEIPIDVKGKAYETFLSATFRGKGLGQFFTPRQVVDFMVNWVDITQKTTMLDPACGSGGFMIKTFQKMREMVFAAPDSYFKTYETTREKTLEDIKKGQIFGVDGEPRATKTAKMNMVMWGDGENVVRGNGLDDKCTDDGTEYPFNKVDINLILANPPFGSKETEEKIYNRYTLGKSSATRKTECLFIERALKTLVPEGELCIVIPDAILASKIMKPVRQVITDSAQVIGVVSLPQHTFTPCGVQTINSSVLYIKKYKKEYFDELEKSSTPNDIEYLSRLKKKYGYDDYSVFMGVAKNVGYEPNGKPTRNRRNDLEQILTDYRTAKKANFYKNDEYHRISENSFTLKLSKTINRLDSRYHWFMKILEDKEFKKVPLGEFIKIKEKKINPKSWPEETFSIISVTNRYGIILDEDDPKKFEVKGADFTQPYKVVSKGDIVFNPYRINVGSIGIVDKEFDGYLVSPAYIVFQTEGGLDKRVLTALFKHPFYKLYIDVLATGSIRNNFGPSFLENILIPKEIIEGDVKNILCDYERINKLNARIKKQKESMIESVGQFL